jgi:hypothetical protein
LAEQIERKMVEGGTTDKAQTASDEKKRGPIIVTKGDGRPNQRAAGK